MSDKGVSNKAAANQTSLRGCLAGSPTSGEYTLTDQQTGMVYHLAGNTTDLRMHIGEQVEVMGDSMNKTNSADAGSSGASGAANAGSASAGSNASTGAISSSQTGNAGSMATGNTGYGSSGASNGFKVSGVTKVADHCGTSKTGPTASM
jgi:hypothetical protein